MSSGPCVLPWGCSGVSLSLVFGLHYHIWLPAARRRVCARVFLKRADVYNRRVARRRDVGVAAGHASPPAARRHPRRVHRGHGSSLFRVFMQKRAARLQEGAAAPRGGGGAPAPPHLYDVGVPDASLHLPRSTPPSRWDRYAVLRVLERPGARDRRAGHARAGARYGERGLCRHRLVPPSSRDRRRRRCCDVGGVLQPERCARLGPPGGGVARGSVGYETTGPFAGGSLPRDLVARRLIRAARRLRRQR